MKSISISPSAAVTAASTWKRLPASNPSPSMVNVPVVRAAGDAVELVAHAALGVVDPVLRRIARACRHRALDQLLDAPADRVGARDERVDVADGLVGGAAVAGDDAEHVARGLAPRQRCTGGSIRPSANVSVASAARPPAETPPTSATWISVPAEVRDAARPTNTGRNTSTSLAWMPPRYGSFSAKTSPGRMVSSGNVLDQRRQRAPQARRVHEAGGRRQRHELAVGVEDGRARVGAFLDEGAVGRADHHDAGLFGRHQQRAADDLGGDLVVDRRCHGVGCSFRRLGRVPDAWSG